MLRAILALILAVLAARAPALHAGEFTILPLRVMLDRAARAGEITVRNEDKAPLRVQIEAMSWRQDADGKDQYEPADGLLYFPRAMEIAPGESRIIRVGVRAAPVSREESYRVFIEELPPATPQSAPPGTATLRVLLRVGVAVFVAPAQIERKGEIARLAVQGRSAEWAIVNTGNVHLRAERVQLAGYSRDGTELFVHEFPERYFLPGATKTLRFDLPRESCGRLATLEASALGENLDLRRKVDVDPASCR